MRALFFAFIALIIGIVAQSCISDDFTDSSAVRLRFSTDTVAFDTVFTDLGTPTARLKVFNPEKKSVNISSIRFKNPDSRFSMNVDGVSGTVFNDVEIRGGDSIFIFIECFIPENNDSKPFLTEDKIEFITNGTEQNVVVEAYGQNVTRLRNLKIDSDMTLTAERPYVVFDSLVVSRGATLTILPGAQVLFHDKASLTVEGTLKAVGEPGKMIDLRGDRLDNVLTDVAYDILSGQWRGIRITADSYDNELSYVDMRSTDNGLRIDSCGNTDRTKLLLHNSWLHNSKGCALESKYAKVDAYGCVFSEAADAAVALYGGVHEFNQCTFSNYYLFAIPANPILSLYHLFPLDALDHPENPNPLMRATFRNSIIYGMTTDINCGDLAESKVFLEYCLLKSAGSDDDNFRNCLWDTDPLFYTVRSDYYFNYRVQPDSPAIGAGNGAYLSSEVMTDMDGLTRNNPPTLGAYVFTPEPASRQLSGK